MRTLRSIKWIECAKVSQVWNMFPIFYLQLCRKYIYALQRAILITNHRRGSVGGLLGRSLPTPSPSPKKKKKKRRLAQAFALRPSLTQRGYFEGREVAEMEVSTKMAAFRNWRWTYCYELVKLLVDEIVIYMQHVPLEISKSILHSPYQHVWPLWLQGRPETCGVAPAAPKDPEGRDARSQSHGWFLILFLKKLDIFGWISMWSRDIIHFEEILPKFVKTPSVFPPKKKNVQFFGGPKKPRHSGFRPRGGRIQNRWWDPTRFIVESYLLMVQKSGAFHPPFGCIN